LAQKNKTAEEVGHMLFGILTNRLTVSHVTTA